MKRKSFVNISGSLSITTVIIILAISGCEKLSSIPTSEDSFIIVPPADLGVVLAGDASILIAWAPVTATGFSYYKVYFGTDSTKLDSIAETTNNYFFIDSLSYDSVYYFRVSAVYENGQESTPSNYVHAEPANLSPPAQPYGLNVYGHNDAFGKYMTVIWSANSEGDLGGYEVYRDTISEFLPDTIHFKNLIDISKVNSLIDTSDIVVGQEYYYKIIAFDFAHWRSVASQPAGDMVLQKPMLITPSNMTTFNYFSQIVFNFTQVKGASGYILYISTSASGGDIYVSYLSSSENSAEFSASAFNPNQLYFWHVAATTHDPSTPNSVSSVFTFSVTQ
jgi:hypothetical protein